MEESTGPTIVSLASNLLADLRHLGRLQNSAQPSP